jgi:RNA polymerase sigma factor (sigma-70 family)
MEALDDTGPAAELNCVDLFISETRHQLLSAEDERRLARAIRAGQMAAESLASTDTDSGDETRLQDLVAAGKQAQEDLAAHNYRLVGKMVRRYKGRGLPEADLWQEGNVTLLRAVSRYDGSVRFSSFAVPCLRNGLLIGLRQERKQRGEGSTGEHGPVLSLEGDCGGDTQDWTETDVAPDTADSGEARRRERLLDDLRPALLAACDEAGLTELQREAIVRCFGLDGDEPESQADLARRRGVRRQAVSDLVRCATAKLRAPEVREKLAGFERLLDV